MIIIPDQPITKTEQDLFGRSEFAKRVAGIITSLKDESSIVVSVNAPWGEGKSSVLNMIEEELGHDAKALVIRFNPWRSSDEEQLLRKYFKALSAKLGKSLGKGKELAKVLKAYADAITPLAELTIPIGGKILGETFKSLVGRREAPDLEELKAEIENYLLKEKKRIVIFMDDIDRLDSREIQAVFRLVKLTADFPYTAYILAFDKEMVSASLAEQFGGKENIEAGRRFIEKIVQVPLPVPPAAPKTLKQMVFDGVESALSSIEVVFTQEETEQFVNVFDNSFRQMLSSPRAVKRYTNMLNFALPILKGEVNMLDLVIIEGVRAFFPTVYETVRTEFGAFLKDSRDNILMDKEKKKARFGELLEELLKGLTDTKKEGVHFALQVLFPNIREYGINAATFHITSNSDDWEKKKRICASSYFRRYFNYGIPPNDISDKEIVGFIDGLGTASIEQVGDRLRAFCLGDRADTLIDKLRMYEDRIVSVDASKLAIAISKRSDLIPESHPLDNFFMIGVLTHAAFLLRELIEREIPTAHDDLAKSVAKNIKGLPFAYEFRRKIRKFETEQGSGEFVRVVSDECEQEIARIFANKLSDAVRSHPLEDSHPLLARSFYIEWRWGNLESLRQYAQRRLEKRPEDVSKFLSALTGISNDAREDFGHPPIQDPDAEFKFLTDILSTDKWVKSINRSYPQVGINQLPPAVRWFVQMYIQKNKESEVFARLPFTSDTDRRVALSVWQLLSESSPMTMKEIASRLDQKEYAVSLILDAFIRNNFVEQHPDNGDGIKYSAMASPSLDFPD
jgi:predicted KAP-like P-loop ATPase